MEVLFQSQDLAGLERGERPGDEYPPEVVKAFRRRMASIRAAADERDLYAMKSNHFEKLKGNRDHQHSLRLNDQWRLVLEIKKGNPKNTAVVIGIEDYH